MPKSTRFLTGLEFGYTLWNVPVAVTKAIRTVDEFHRRVRRTGVYEDNASDINMELFFDDSLENPSVDEERLRLVNSSISFGFLGSILMFEIPVPFELL